MPSTTSEYALRALSHPACSLTGERACSDDAPCSAHARWRQMRQAYIDFLETTSLADISHHPSRASEETQP